MDTGVVERLRGIRYLGPIVAKESLVHGTVNLNEDACRGDALDIGMVAYHR